jgi:hypothetical protein
MSRLLWLLPPALGFCFIFYSCIIAYEEDLLLGRFGDDYARYMTAIPRWLPSRRSRRDREVPPEGSSWFDAFRRERSTLYGIAAGTAMFILKDFLSRSF